MAETLFNQFADEGALQAQRDFVLKEILGPIKKDIQGLNIKIGAIDSSQSKKSVDELSIVMDILSKNTKIVQQRITELNSTLKDFAQLSGNSAKALREAAQAALLQAKANTENAKTEHELAKAKQQTAKAAGDVAKAAAQEEKAAQQLAKTKQEEAKAEAELAKIKLIEAKTAQELSKTVIQEGKAQADAAMQSAKAKAIEAKETDRKAASLKKEAEASAKLAAKRTEEARPYRQLALAFAAAAKEAQDLAAKYGTMDKRSQAAAKRANELNNELKKIDASIGNNQRNVGNYPKTFDKIGLSLKNLATNFLALAGVTSIGFLFKSSIDEFVEMEKNVRQLQNTLKNLGVPEAFDRISASANRLQEQFGFIDNDEILKSFNQLIVYGKLTEKQINELIPVIIDFAAASGQDLGSATSLIIKSLEGNGKALKEYGINMKDAGSTTEAFSIIMKELKPRVDGVAAAFAGSSSGGLAKAKQDFADLKEEIGSGLLPVLNKVLTFFNEAIKGAQMLAKDIGLLFSGGPGAVAKNFDEETTKGAIKNIEEKFRLLDVNQRIDERNKLQVAIGEQNKLLKDLSQGGTLFEQGLSSPERIKQIEKKIDFNKRLLDVLFKLQNEGDNSGKVLGIGDPNDSFSKDKTSDADKKAAELAERIRKANFEAAKAAQLENIKLQEEIFKDDTQSFEKRIAALRQFVQEKARLIELERQFEKGTKGITKEEIAKIETEKQTELNQLLRDGHRDYNNILEDQTKEEQRIHQENADRIKKIHEDLQKSIIKGLQEADEELKKQIEAQDDLRQARQKAMDQLTETGFDILLGTYDAQINKIRDQIDAVNELKAAEIDRINSSTATAEEKAARIKIVEARAQNDREALERRQRNIERQKAVVARAQQLFEITIQGIRTVAAIKLQALAAINPILKGLILAQIPFALATTAAALAGVIATPIPKFAKGKNASDNYEGLAIVGEAGREIGINEKGKVSLYDKPTLTYLTKGTQILPNKVTEDMMRATMTDKQKMFYLFNDKPISDNKAMEAKTDRVIKELKQLNGKPSTIIMANQTIELSAWYQQHFKS